MSNKAAWLIQKGQPLEIKTAPYPKPADNQIVIRNHAVAINPVDWMLAALGTMVFSWLKFPHILGCDVAGEVVEVGSKVTNYKPGDRVVGMSLGVTKGNVDTSQGAFQEIVLLREDVCALIPQEITYEQASVIGLGFSTAACGLYQKDYLNFPLPQAENVKSTGKVVLIWGGSTSVGANAIQLARASGYEVFTTCSQHNFEFVKKLGASQVWDYKSSTVVNDIVKALQEKDFAGALSIGPGSAEMCVSIASQLKKGEKFVAMASQPGQPTGIPEGIVGVASVLTKMMVSMIMVGGKSLIYGVKTNFIFGSDLIDNEVGPGVWKNYLGAALENKTFLPMPEAEIVSKKGLEGLQDGLDLQKKGVSAKKIVVSL